jgi:hypothetical protein
MKCKHDVEPVDIDFDKYDGISIGVTWQCKKCKEKVDVKHDIVCD